MPVKECLLDYFHIDLMFQILKLLACDDISEAKASSGFIIS